MVLLEAGRLPEGRYLGLWKLAELRGIEDRGDSIDIGALTTYTDVLRHATLRRDFPLLCRAAEETGGVATQNRGALGGNIANGSPAADTPPRCSPTTRRSSWSRRAVLGALRTTRFHLGYKRMDLAPDELIARSCCRSGPPVGRILPESRHPPGAGDLEGLSGRDPRHRFVRRRRARRADRVRQRRAGPASAKRAEAALRGSAPDKATLEQALQALTNDIAPIDDLRSTARYRLRVAQSLLGECLDESRQLPGF